MPWRVAPQVRLELTTLRLTAECSAIELLRIIRGLSCSLLPARRSALSASGTFTLVFGARPGFAHHFWLALRLGSCLGFAARPASARCLAAPFFLMFWEREKLSFLPLLLDPGNFLLSQAVPSSVPSAFGGLTSVFCMGTGGALQLSSPETFRREASLSLPTPRTFKTAQVQELTSYPNTLLSLSSPDQALDRLVSPSSTRYRASTDDLSTSSSLRGLTCFKQWQSSSSGGLHA